MAGAAASAEEFR